MSAGNFEFKTSRTFDALRDTVWQAWTQERQLQQWFGPKGCPVFFSKLSLAPGGIYHYGMKTPDGGEIWGRWTFRTIQPPEKLEFFSSFSDRDGQGATRHPWQPDWPLELLSTVTFLEHGSKTEVVVQWQPHNAAEIERRTFKNGQASMQKGWAGTFDQLADFLGS